MQFVQVVQYSKPRRKHRQVPLLLAKLIFALDKSYCFHIWEFYFFK